MAKSVSNDALWEKLSEIEKKLDKLFEMQKTLLPKQEQIEIKPDFKGVKDEIIAKIESEADLLGNHSDSCYKAINQNIATLDEVIRKVWNIVARIRKQQREDISLPKEERDYFNFRFFKVRKTYFVIAILVLVVFVLVLFA